MAKLSQFSNNKDTNQNNVNAQRKASRADIEEKFNTYKDMSQEELNNQLFQEVARQKRDGSFDYNGLARMVESLQGSLTPNEYENIKRLLESLK